MVLANLRYYFSKDDLLALLKLLILPAALVIGVLSLWLALETKDYLTNPTFGRIQRLAETELPKGADKAEVLAFLDRNKIGHGDYQPIAAIEKSESSEFKADKLKLNLDSVHYRIYAGRNVSNWSWPLGCWGQFRFYFDHNGKLVDYELYQLCDG